MGWFSNWIRNFKESDNKPLEDEIERLNFIINGLNIELEELRTEKLLIENEVVSQEQEIIEQQDYLDSLETKIPRIKISAKPTKYPFKNGRSEYLHKSLNDFSKDEESIGEYVSFLQTLHLDNSYSEVDLLVYDVVRQVQNWIEDNISQDYVAEDKEYWPDPQEAFKIFVLGKTGEDCDGRRALLYGAIISALIFYGFENEIFRLLCVDVKITGVGGHAILAWERDNGVFAHIESTYGEDYFTPNWHDNRDVFRSIYARTWHVFDENTEYELK